MKKYFLILSCVFNIACIAQNVGVGTSSPVEKLDVNGNIQASGTLNAASYKFASPKTYYYALSGSDFLANKFRRY